MIEIDKTEIEHIETFLDHFNIFKEKVSKKQTVPLKDYELIALYNTYMQISLKIAL